MPLKDPFIVFVLLSVAVSACAADKALDRAVAERLAGNDAEALASVNPESYILRTRQAFLK